MLVSLALPAAGLAIAAAGVAAAASSGQPTEYRALKTVRGGTPTAGPLSLDRVTVGQVGDSLYLGVRTQSSWSTSSLASPGRGICLLLAPAGAPAKPDRRICTVAQHGHRDPGLWVEHLGRNGSAGRPRTLHATVTRSDNRSFAAQIPLAELGLAPGRFRWSAHASWRGARCGKTASPCSETVPASGSVAARIAAVHPVGCTRPRDEWIFSGPKRPRAIALSFDDGPSTYTPEVLKELEREHVNATFFTIGQQIAPRASYLRRELSDGDVVGNHTWDHQDVAGGGSFAYQELSATSHEIERVTHFTPCLFRAPYGDVRPPLLSVASSLRLTTIQWDIDPRDWSRPGTAAIEQNVLSNAHPGAIVIMHDGGGPRQETVDALPTIIRTLRHRGYTFETVPQLLGQRLIYGR